MLGSEPSSVDSSLHGPGSRGPIMGHRGDFPGHRRVIPSGIAPPAPGASLSVFLRSSGLRTAAGRWASPPGLTTSPPALPLTTCSRARSLRLLPQQLF